jgi:hypothetical protein
MVNIDLKQKCLKESGMASTLHDHENVMKIEK